MSPLLQRVTLPVLGWLARRHLAGVDKRLLVISYPRQGGRAYSMPLGYLRQEGSFYVVDAGGNEQWFRALQEAGEVRVHADGGDHDVLVDFVREPDEIARLLEGCRGLYGGRYERFLGVPAAMPAEQAARSPLLRASFVRFRPPG